MNPILKYILGAGVRHLITIILTLLVARHFIGQDIADKLMRGDTLTLWQGYNLNLQTMVDYVVLTLIPASPVILAAAWGRIKSAFKAIAALRANSPSQLKSIVNATGSGEKIATVATTPLVALLCASLFLSGCATPGPNPGPVTRTGQDLATAAAKLIQAYIYAKSGNVNYVWSIEQGLELYQLYLKTAGDVKAIVQAWGDQTKEGKTLAEKLAQLFAESSGSGPQKTEALALGAMTAAAANTGSP